MKKGFIIEILLKETSSGEKNQHYCMAATSPRKGGLWCRDDKVTVFNTKKEAEEAIRSSRKYSQKMRLDWSNFEYRILKLV